jgi:hypothetical protein
MTRSSRRHLSLRSEGSTSNTVPLISAYPSIYPSEDEGVSDVKFTPFKFLELPSELRNKIYGHVFSASPPIVDLDPENSQKIHRYMSLFLVSKQINNEATYHFFSTHTIRLFPVHPGRFFRTLRPLLSRLRPRFRACISALELMLGPGWQNPPRGWVVKDSLGLRDAVNVRILKVMVQVDTSDPIYNGFRREDGFYERFSRNLLDDILKSVPSIVEIQFDGYQTIRKEGPMMRGLLEVANKHNKILSWGPKGCWDEEIEINAALDNLSVGPVLKNPRSLSVILA